MVLTASDKAGSSRNPQGLERVHPFASTHGNWRISVHFLFRPSMLPVHPFAPHHSTPSLIAASAGSEGCIAAGPRARRPLAGRRHASRKPQEPTQRIVPRVHIATAPLVGWERLELLMGDRYAAVHNAHVTYDLRHTHTPRGFPVCC